MPVACWRRALVYALAMKILLVDDDTTLCALLAEYLGGEGFSVAMAHNGDSALATLTEHAFDAIVLDIMMPGKNGLDVLRELRAISQIPVIMLTGRGDDFDRILGLELGADDYMTKPCNPRELAARLRAILRRVNYGGPSQVADRLPTKLACHGIELDRNTLEARINHQLLNLTQAEFNTLYALMEALGTPLSKAVLTEKVLHRKLTRFDRSIDVHVSRIRAKLAAVGVNDIIQAIRGVGYQMVAERS